MLRKVFIIVLCVLAVLACKKESRNGEAVEIAVTGGVADLTPNSVTLIAHFNPGSIMSDYKTEMRCSSTTDLTPGSSSGYVWSGTLESVENGEYRYKYTNLLPGTTYYYQAVLYYYSFKKIYYHGQVKQFTTPAQ